MEIPLQISLHGVAHSDSLYQAIREKAEKLERHYERIMSCRVVLELADHHRQHGRRFAARIHLKLPGDEIAVTRAHHEDVYVALRDALRCGAATARGRLPQPARRREDASGLELEERR